MIHIQQIRIEELNALIDIHARALPDDVLPNIGQGAITRYYQKIFDEFRNKKDAIYKVYQQAEFLDERNVKQTLKYYDEFYKIIDNPKAVEREFIRKAHTAF